MAATELRLVLVFLDTIIAAFTVVVEGRSTRAKRCDLAPGLGLQVGIIAYFEAGGRDCLSDRIPLVKGQPLDLLFASEPALGLLNA